MDLRYSIWFGPTWGDTVAPGVGPRWPKGKPMSWNLGSKSMSLGSMRVGKVL
jgi:hypothetical protein